MQPAALPPILKARYRLIQHVGRGGMATVYRAIDETLAREVAIKLLHPDLLHKDIGQQRFMREARLLARLTHPNIVSIYDADSDAGWRYLVLEYVPGQDAARLLDENTAGIEALRAEKIVRETLKALAFAHAHGVYHRDIKPHNILLTGDDGVKVGDFGLARLVGDARLTQHNTLQGTVPYMAPEIFLETQIDHRADLYAVGAMWYELLTGQPPFRPTDTISLIASILHTPAPSLFSAPEHVQKIVGKLLAKQPDERYASAQEVLAALDGITAAPGPPAPAEIPAEIARYSAREARTHAVETERKRLAELLEGQLMNSLSLLQAQAAMYEQAIAGGEARMVASVLGTLARQAIQQVRDFSANLHPSVLERLGLEVALENLADQTRRTHGIHITLQLERQRERLPATLEMALFRVVQEAVERAIHHTHVATMTVHLAHQPPVIILTIGDESSDLTGVERWQEAQERIEHLGGKFAFRAVEGGTELTATLRHQPPIELTPREMDVLLLVVEGLSNKEIARRLSLSPRTVNFHLDNIYSKLGVNSRTEAAIYALRQGWTKRLR